MRQELEKLQGLIAVVTMAFAEGEEDFMGTAVAAGLTARQVNHLDTINSLGNPSPSELAGRLGLTRPTVTALLSRLRAGGYIRKAKSDVDRRGYHIHVTGKGRELIRAHESVHRKLAEAFAASLDQKELETLIRLISKAFRAIGYGAGLGAVSAAGR